jgi:hypothetical protein
MIKCKCGSATTIRRNEVMVCFNCLVQDKVKREEASE